MAEAVGVPQDQRGSTNFHALNGVLSNEQDSFGDIVALAPKTRKPYTITKQRERWTEEEHKKFLEALQLHGRAWRRIEEHIGTKTAVQIRSHAQKFFSKVTRDATGNGTGDMKPIEIPPPRPKKKPTHPYPRKQVLSCTKGIPFLGRLKRSSSPVLSVSEPENRSPTSVLSAVRSESIDPFFSNNPNGCAWPAGFAPGSNDYENGIPSPTNSVEGDDRHLSLGLTSTGLTTEDESSMELDMSSSVEHIHSKDAPSREAIVPTLKLFGKTMVVTDSYKPFSATAGDAAHRSAQEAISESNCNGSEFYPEKPTEEMVNGNFLMNNTWPGGLLPTFYCWPPSFGDAANLAAEARVVPLPWWPFHGNMPFPYAYYSQQNLSSREDLLQFNLQNECSGTGSNSAFEGANAVESEQSDLGSDYKEAAFDLLPKPRKVEIGAAVTDRKCSRGFVPYRRGALEGKVKSPDISGEAVGDNNQAVKLCL